MTGRRPGRGRPGTARTLTLLVVAGAALVLGAAAGVGQARAGADQASSRNTRVIVSLATLDQAPGGPAYGQGLPTHLEASAVSTGAGVILVGLLTPAGEVILGEDAVLERGVPARVPIRIRRDCHTGDDPADQAAATAVVRDRPGGRTRQVPATLTGDLIAFGFIAPCAWGRAGPAVDPDRVRVSVQDSVASTAGYLRTTVRVAGAAPEPVLVQVVVADELSGQGEGGLRLVSAPPTPVLALPGSPAELSIQLRYRCRGAGPQTLPPLETVLRPRAWTLGGWAVTVDGWAPAQAGRAVKAAVERAGCTVAAGSG